jgi:hypothetical protein
LRIELEPLIGEGVTAAEAETLAGRMRAAVIGALEQVTAVTVVPRLPSPGPPR